MDINIETKIDVQVQLEIEIETYLWEYIDLQINFDAQTNIETERHT